MAEKLNAELREDFGKGAARRIRANDKVPAVVYGSGLEPLHIIVPGHEMALAARNPNALLELVLPGGDTRLGLIKDIQRHPLKRTLTHIDFVAVKRGQKVEVDIPVVVTGEPVSPAVSFVDSQTLTLSVDALKVPEQIEIDVEGKEEGYQLFAGDVVLPEGAELVTDAELLVVSISVPQVDESDLETPAAEDEEGAEEPTDDTEKESAEGDSEE